MGFFYRFCWCLVAPIARLILPTKIVGKQNMPKGRAVLACNHRSNFDVIVFDVCRYRMPYVLAKHTLFDKKFNAKVLKSFGAIPVNRQDLSTTTVRTVLKVLNDDNHLLIFPEGTRKDSLDETVALKNGMALFALKTNAPIVPMYMVKKPEFFKMNKIIIGEPISMEAYAGKRPTKEVLSEVSAKVMDEMWKLKTDYENSLSPKQLAKYNRQLQHTIEKDNKRRAKRERKKLAKEQKMLKKQNKEQV